MVRYFDMLGGVYPMKKLAVLAVFLVAAFPACAFQTGALKLSLWDNLAITAPAHSQDISGLDFGIGSNTSAVTGLQWDLVWAQTQYELKGASIAFIVSMANQVKGVQTAAFVKAADVTGAQLGVVNLGLTINGVQLGFVNQTDYLHGLQFGFVNYAREIEKGLQIGILNIAENGWVPVMIIANGRF